MPPSTSAYSCAFVANIFLSRTPISSVKLPNERSRPVRTLMARPALRTLATIGIFSVLSYSVARRTHEIGVRMALGAERGHVLNLMLAMGAKLVLAGLAIGLGGSFLLARYLKSAVFEVPVTDPLSLLGVVTLLSGAGFFACLLPARRAARLEPTTALRHE